MDDGGEESGSRDGAPPPRPPSSLPAPPPRFSPPPPPPPPQEKVDAPPDVRALRLATLLIGGLIALVILLLGLADGDLAWALGMIAVMRGFFPKQMSKRFSVLQYHPAAERFYKSKGLWAN